MDVSLSIVLSTGVSAAILHVAISAFVWRGTGEESLHLSLVRMVHIIFSSWD